MMMSLRSRLLTLALGCTALAAGPTAAHAANLATDNASNYLVGGWVNGSNAGSGFGPWVIGTNLATAIESSNLNGGAPNIDEAGVAFRIRRSTASFSQVTRSFTGGALSLDQTFVFSLDLSLLTGTSAAGFYLTNSSEGERWGLQYVGNKANLDLKVNATTFDSGIPVSGLLNGLDVAFTLQADLAWSATFTPRGGGASSTLSSANFAAVAEAPDGFRFFFANTTVSQNQYLNSVAIVPEPSACLLALSGAALLGGMRRRRSSTLSSGVTWK